MRDYAEKMIAHGAKVLSDWKSPKSCKKKLIIWTKNE